MAMGPTENRYEITYTRTDDPSAGSCRIWWSPIESSVLDYSFFFGPDVPGRQRCLCLKRWIMFRDPVLDQLNEFFRLRHNLLCLSLCRNKGQPRV